MTTIIGYVLMFAAVSHQAGPPPTVWTLPSVAGVCVTADTVTWICAR